MLARFARLGLALGAAACSDGCMTDHDAFADLFEANEHYAADEHDVFETGVARRGLAIVTCIDSRIDPLAVFGLEQGDAKILRNAGARITDDVMRSLSLAVAALGVVRIAVVQHTDCKMTEPHDDLVAAVAEATGAVPAGWDPLAIADQAAALQADVDIVRASPLIPAGVIVGGLVLDLHSGRLRAEVEPAPATGG
jgi:carbonic anhydrase